MLLIFLPVSNHLRYLTFIFYVIPTPLIVISHHFAILFCCSSFLYWVTILIIVSYVSNFSTTPTNTEPPFSFQGSQTLPLKHSLNLVVSVLPLCCLYTLLLTFVYLDDIMLKEDSQKEKRQIQIHLSHMWSKDKWQGNHSSVFKD